MAVLLGLAASVSWGTADYLGGIVTRRMAASAAVLLSQAVGLTLLVVALPIVLGEAATAPAVGWGAVGGLAGAAGVVFLYRGLAHGRMSVVAPISGVVGASVPAVFGLAIGENPEPATLAGIVLAMLAVGLVSWTPETSVVQPTVPDSGSNREEPADPEPFRRGIPEGFGAGLGFGAFFIAFNEAGDAGGGLWPLLSARSASVVVLAMLAMLARRPVRPPPGTLVTISVVGALDAGANLLYLLGSRLGLVSVVAVLASLYPATTVVLARAFLRERMSPVQLTGMALAAVGIVLITAG